MAISAMKVSSDILHAAFNQDSYLSPAKVFHFFLKWKLFFGFEASLHQMFSGQPEFPTGGLNKKNQKTFTLTSNFQH